ncbi:hypothetical protein ES706_05769 [subsurface metagenome]
MLSFRPRPAKIKLMVLALAVALVLSLVPPLSSQPIVSASPDPMENELQFYGDVSGEEWHAWMKTGDKIVIKDKNKVQSLTLTRWDNRVSISILPPWTSANITECALEVEENGKLKWKLKDTEGHEIELEMELRNEENISEIIAGENLSFTQMFGGGVDFDLKLDWKATELNFYISGYETLDFFYQPPLHPDHPTWADTDNDGVADTLCSANVVGSYAVYHKWKRDYVVGGTNYANGKLFHIYRPKIIDDDQNWVWGKLSFDEGTGVLTVTIPQDWLENAKTPIWIDPTFGYESIGGQILESYSTINGSWFTAPEDIMNIHSIVAYLRAKSVDVNYSDAIYSGGQGEVADYLEETSSGFLKGGDPADWYTLDLDSPVSATGGSDYWILTGMAGDGVYYNKYYDSVSNKGIHHYKSGGWASWPPTINTPAEATDKKFSIYCIYTAKGPPEEPTLVSPENNHSTIDKTPTFTWAAGLGATSHRLVIDDSQNFDDGENIYDNANLGGSATSCTIENELPVDNYWWNVCATNAEGDNWSENTWTFERMLATRPSLVGTSTSFNATMDPTQRKTFYAAQRFWVWYSDGTNFVYRSSTDGLYWSDAASVGACQYGYAGSVWFDGTYVHYARWASNNNNYYRRGTPNSDGTITWSADEQTVHDGTSTDVHWTPNITVDSGGYAWIGTQYYDGNLKYPWVFKNAENDGTWSTATGFPYQLSTTYSDTWRVSVVPLTDSKVYAIYAYKGYAAYGKLWSGSSWGDEETTMSKSYDGYAHSAVAEGDNVHLVFLHYDLTPGIRYNKRTYGTGWGTGVTVQADGVDEMAPVLSIDTASGDLYCFWAGSPAADMIYYKKQVSGSWDADPTLWQDETSDGFPYGWYCFLTCFYQAYNYKIGLLYTTKTGSPYNVKFDFLQLEVPPNVAPEILTSFTPATVNPNAAFDVEIEVRDNDEISDIEEVWLVVYENIKSQGDADNARNHYTFKWVRAGADNWFEVGPDAGGSHINVGSCVKGDDAKTTDNFLFNIKLGVAASPNNSWNVWAKVIDSASEEDSEEFLAKFSVTEYLSLAIDDETLTFSGNPGETDKAAPENPTVCTVDSNTDFKIQVRLSGDWSGSVYGGSIPMANTYADQDGSSPYTVTLTAGYQDLWPSVGWGEGVARDCYWFLDFPLPLRDDVYSTTFYVNVVKS